MSGLIGAKGSQSSLITSISGVDSQYGGVVDLNYLIYEMFGANMNTPSSTNVTNFNSDNSINQFWNPRVHHPITPHTQGYRYLFGPNYTSVDIANGGWRIGFSFSVPVRIDYVIVASANTNARAKNFGMYHKSAPDGTATFHESQYAGLIDNPHSSVSTTSRTLFGSAVNLVSLVNTDRPHRVIYEDLVGEHFIATFGDEYHNNGNANAGIGCLIFYGQAL